MMFELWVPLTIIAAFFQNLRSALQKNLKSRLSNSGATYVRFFYAWPFATIYVLILHSYGGFGIPDISPTFLLYCFFGGLSQIFFTFLLVWLFSFRNFAAGTIFSKTETKDIKPGIFSAPCSIELYAEIFDQENSIDNLEYFSSINGPNFYDLPVNTKKIKIIKEKWRLGEYTLHNDIKIKNFYGGEELNWKVI